MEMKQGIEIELKKSNIPYTIFRLTGFYQGLIEQYAIPILENLPIWVTDENTCVSIYEMYVFSLVTQIGKFSNIGIAYCSINP